MAKPAGLGQGIEEILDDLRGTPPSAAFCSLPTASTPREKRCPKPRRRRSAKGCRCSPWRVGSELPTRDLELTDLLVDDVVFVNDVVNFEFQLAGAGFEGRQVKVVLREKGKEAAAGRE